MLIFQENVESEIYRNFSQKQREYQWVVWGNFQVGEEQGFVSAANRRHGKEEEEMHNMLNADKCTTNIFLSSFKYLYEFTFLFRFSTQILHLRLYK